MNGKRDHRLLTLLQGALFSALYSVLALMNQVAWPAALGIIVLFMSLSVTGVVQQTRRIRAGEESERRIEESERRIEESERRIEESERKRLAEQQPAPADPVRDIRELEGRVALGAITLDEAQALYTALQTAPAEQLEQLSRQYGLPVNIAPPVTAGSITHTCPGPGGHRRYYTDVRFCPEHRDQGMWAQLKEAGENIAEAEAMVRRRRQRDLEAELRELHVPELDIQPESLHDQLVRITGTCSCPVCTPGEPDTQPETQPDTQPETRPEDLLPDPVTAADEAAAGYVPEGEAELLEALRRDLRVQWLDAVDGRKEKRVPFPGHWEMSPAWAADVRKLRKLDGELLWAPRMYTLYGYCVKIDTAYGAPELKGA
jgi:hypothetical protein